MGKTATDAQMAAWTEERARFQRILPDLWRDERYRNRYVAVRQGEVVDADDDKMALARRLVRRFPRQSVFVGAVRRQQREAEMPSPEVEH